jgi:hypothetical protein
MTRTLEKIDQWQKSEDENLPMAENKSLTESDAASRTKFELVSAFKQANINIYLFFSFKQGAYKFENRFRIYSDLT